MKMKIFYCILLLTTDVAKLTVFDGFKIGLMDDFESTKGFQSL